MIGRHESGNEGTFSLDRRRTLRLAAIAGVSATLPASGVASATGNANRRRLDGFERRRADLFGKVTDTSYSPHSMRVKRAVGSLWLEQDVDAVNEYLAGIEYGEFGGIGRAGSLYWVLPDLVRIYEQFGSESGAGLLTVAAERNLLANVFVPYFDLRKPLFSEDINDPTVVLGSENHDLMQRCSAFRIARVMRDQSRIDATFPDGKAGDSFDEFHTIALEFFREKFLHEATHGIWIEGGGTYRLMSLINYYNVRDFAADEELATLAEMVLNLVWLDYAHLSLEGVRGGPKARVSNDWDSGAEDPVTVLGATYFGHEAIPPEALPDDAYVWPRPVPCLATNYRPPSLAADLLSSPEKRGTYEYVTRFPGMGTHYRRGPRGEDIVYELDSEASVLNYSYVTPSFVMGSFMQNPTEPVTNLSDQARWEGTVFGSGPRTRIQSYITGVERRLIDEFTTMQHGPITMTKSTIDGGNFALEAYPSPDVEQEAVRELIERDGWLFGRSGDGFYGMRAAAGSLTRSEGRTLHTSQTTVFEPETNVTPVVVHAGTADRHGSFEAFREHVAGNGVEYDGFSELRYVDDEWGELVFRPNARDPERIRVVDGEPVTYDRERLFDSPYLRSDWRSGLVRAEFGDESAEYDFRQYSDDLPVETATPSTTPESTASPTPGDRSPPETEQPTETPTTGTDTSTSSSGPGFSALAALGGVGSGLAAARWLGGGEDESQDAS